jgi:hypothetical protein
MKNGASEETPFWVLLKVLLFAKGVARLDK